MLQIGSNARVIMIRSKRHDGALLGRPKSGDDLFIAHGAADERLHRCPEGLDAKGKRVGQCTVEIEYDAFDFHPERYIIHLFSQAADIRSEFFPYI